MRSAAASTIRARVAAPRAVKRDRGGWGSVFRLQTIPNSGLDSPVFGSQSGLTSPQRPGSRYPMSALHDRPAAALLRNGQVFPRLEIPAVGGGTISLPGDLAGSYGVVLIYRGSWCPYCNAQLASFS